MLNIRPSLSSHQQTPILHNLGKANKTNHFGSHAGTVVWQVADARHTRVHTLDPPPLNPAFVTLAQLFLRVVQHSCHKHKLNGTSFTTMLLPPMPASKSGVRMSVSSVPLPLAQHADTERFAKNFVFRTLVHVVQHTSSIRISWHNTYTVHFELTSNTHTHSILAKTASKRRRQPLLLPLRSSVCEYIKSLHQQSD